MSDEWVPPGIDNTKAHAARVYDYVLGGKDNYAVDREFAAKIMSAVPDYPVMAKANRAFLVRAVEHLAKAGIRQFIDLGTGIPTSPNTHEVARQHQPDARVLYVDNDPIVAVYSGALLATDDLVASLTCDIRDTDRIINDPATTRLIDFSEPVGVLAISVVQLIPDEAVPVALAAFRERMAPGSYLALTQPSSEGDPAVVAHVREVMKGGPIPISFRSQAHITTFFDGFELLDPGVVEVTKWPEPYLAEKTGMLQIGGVARRP
ncbi:SAM-dependent methyltransferase [Streptosporangiaceae bacterium NEAU-GS5]|nr:SAM-dependent methyltransferase [Streptosporangiaceae bacterium NEAU-GS5]